jgi:hypothetical protein
MIKEGYYECDYCNDKNQDGNFYTATGNHVACQDAYKLQARLEALEKVAEQMAKAIHKQYGLYEALAYYEEWKLAQ